ncbi:NusA N-terminal domain-containing protein [Mycoplasma seminis]|uniref:NusA N-terminal domain-containing protein n=1 Tax=Mycoplasma seminis TaxID=512749 RepID=A0ABY9HAY6_9MOLU|nr:NusA N-terminal domain-containing protein [Mycoplasma seminis]WLP85350.1 NusA N-terminal domain-containing protein [Mycoplasma seminis]
MASKKANTEVINSEEYQLFRLIEEASTSKDIDFNSVAEIFRQAVEKATTKNIDPNIEVSLETDFENKITRMYNVNGEVVEDDFEFNQDTPEEKIIFMTLSQARLSNPDIQVYDAVKIPFTCADLTNKINVAILNDYKQASKAMEKAKIIAKYSQKLGQKVDAKVLTRNKNGSYNVAFEDQVTAFLPANKVNEKLNLQPGKFISVYIDAINEESKLSIVSVSTTSNTELFDLLFTEIPEIQNDDLQVVSIQRVAGIRSKVALRVNPDRKIDFDMIGTVLGESAQRLNAISETLGGEKIDLIKFSDDKAEYIKNALAPARVIDVVPNLAEGEGNFYAITRNGEVNVAIGKRGINIELASKLTNTRIQAITATEAVEKQIPFNNVVDFEPHYFKSTERNKNSKTARTLNNLDTFIDTDSLFEDFNSSALDEFGNVIEETPKKSKKSAPKNKGINIADFDSLFDNDKISELESVTNYDFISEIDKYDDEFEDEDAEAEDVVESSEEKEAKAKKVLREFKNSKVELKDFKVDSDLASYGLDDSIDMDELASDDWE